MVSPDVWDVEAQVRFLLPRPSKGNVMSKGSTPRPYSVSQEEFANSFDRIFRKPSPKDIEDARNEQEAFDKIEEKMYTAQSEGDKKCK